MSTTSSFSAVSNCLGGLFYFIYLSILYFHFLDFFFVARICHATLCHLYARSGPRSGHTDSLGGFGLVDGDNASGMTRTVVRWLLPDAPDAPGNAYSLR